MSDDLSSLRRMQGTQGQKIGGLKAQAQKDREEWRGGISKINMFLWPIWINLAIFEAIIIADRLSPAFNRFICNLVSNGLYGG